MPVYLAKTPPLGPALPGDLGRPILNAQNAPSATVSAIDAAQQRIGQEVEAARLSKLFASTGIRELALPSAQSASTEAATSSQPGQPARSTADEAFAQNGQDRKLAFVSGSLDRRITSPDRVTKASLALCRASQVSEITAALITGIRSDLPGQITAQVTENVYNSPTGRFLLIPQGARLIGVYDSQVAFGQSRVLLVWTRLIMPNGRSTVLERQPGADTAGYAGLEDGVDNKTWDALFKAALLSTLLGVGSGVGSRLRCRQQRRHHPGASSRLKRQLDRTGQRATERNLNIQPTLTIRPGFPGAGHCQP